MVAEESQPPSEPVRRYVEPRFPYCPSRASLPESSPGPQSLCSSVAFPWRTTQELTGPPHTNGGVPAWLPSTKCRDPGPLHNFSCYSCLSHRHKPLVPSCPCPSPRPTSGGELVSDDLVHLGADLPFESTPDSGVDLSRERRGCGLVDPSLRPAKPRQRRGPRVRGLPSGGGAVCRSWRHASGPPRACPWRQQHGEGRPLRRTYIGDGGDVAFVESGPQIPATDTDGRGSYPVVGEFTGPDASVDGLGRHPRLSSGLRNGDQFIWVVLAGTCFVSHVQPRSATGGEAQSEIPGSCHPRVIARKRGAMKC